MNSAKRVLWVCLLTGMIGCTTAVEQRQERIQPQVSAPANTGNEPWRQQLGNLHHPVSTQNAEAQKAFNEGLTLAYAFNHDEAQRSFERAARLDPNLAMAWWGVAYVLGPNYNMPIGPEKEKQAFEAIRRAQSLAANATDSERAYIAAMLRRYTDAARPDYKALDVAYKEAMKGVVERYPDDPDAATLYAESLMLLRPWHLWTHAGEPAPETPEILSILERTLDRWPDHVGANHLYIHSVEASRHPEWALASADRIGSLAPGAGHIVHMASHIYSRVGDFPAAARANESAIAADRAYLRNGGIRNGVYDMMYYSHNMHFLSYAETQRGRLADARQWSTALAGHVAPHIAMMPMLEGFMPTPTMVLVRFHQWDDILKLPEPDKSMPSTHALWHFARGMAYAGQGQATPARQEQSAMDAEINVIPGTMVFSPYNTARDVLAIAQRMLSGKIALADGDRATAIANFRDAVRHEDHLNYIEPPDWFLPSREALGGALLLDGQYAPAERVFRDDLEKNRRNARSLFGLRESLKAQGKTDQAAWVGREFDNAWKDADTKLTVEGL